MNEEHIKIGKEATDKMVAGAVKLSEIVSTTLGADGKSCLFELPSVGLPLSTKDGKNLSALVNFRDRFENAGASVVKFAANKSATEAGDGTTTVIALSANLIEKGMALINKGAKSRMVIKGMKIAKDEIKKILIEKSVNITHDSDRIKKVALVSSNYDEQISEMISSAIKQYGENTVINVEKSLGGETSITMQDGMTIQTSFVHEVFVNNTHNECLLENVAIIICDYDITSIKEVGSIFSKIEGQGSTGTLNKNGTRRKVGGYLFIGKDYAGEALSSLAKSKAENNAPIAIAKAPVGDDFGILIRDIAIKTGGKVISESEGVVMENIDVDNYLGWAEKIILSKDNLVIIGGDSDADLYNKRLDSLTDLEEKEDNENNKNVYAQRKARLKGSVAKLTIGGDNDAIVKARADSADDARMAVKSAMEEGILPGGGISWLESLNGETSVQKESGDVQLGMQLLREALLIPIEILLTNSGFTEEERNKMVVDILASSNGVGYNAISDKIEDLMEVGIVDPTKVLRCALENSVTVAAQFMETGSALYVIANQPR